MPVRHFALGDAASLRKCGEELTAMRQRSLIEPMPSRE
jgi:hypothetical protein